ncbi:MAG: hypothetical protein EU529_11900 [Promethearchaeota archaeon]|nr:MAG: hypothetical protein EU529_11900 [Candidatus Lokiarchaeota archaeon]
MNKDVIKKVSKAILYGLFIVSLLLPFIYIFFSYFTIAKPVSKYEFGVPDIAKGMTTEGQVILYDEDEWNNHLGVGADNPDDYFGGDADVVGAKSKTKVLDWEEDEEILEFFSDFILTTSIEVEGIEELTDFNSVFDYVADGIWGLADPESDQGAVGLLYEGIISKPLSWNDTKNAPPGSAQAYVAGNGSIAIDTCTNFPMDTAYVNEKYAEKLDGVLLEREAWDYTVEDYDDNPDLEGDEADAPFLDDPHEWYNAFKRLTALENELYAQCDKVVYSIRAFNDSFTNLKNKVPTAWSTVNDQIADKIVTDLGIPAIRPSEGGDNLPALVLDAALNPTGENPLQQGSEGILAVYDLVSDNVPDKFNFLFSLLLEGLPTYTPVHKYLSKVVDDFDLDGTVPETYISGLNPDLKVYGDVELDGTVLTLKFDYEDGTVDPDNPDKILKNWEISFVYGDEGSQGSIILRDEDGKVFYQTGGLGYLPELEVTIIIGISTLFVIMLIYAVLIRRKSEHKFLDKLRKR